MVWVLLTTSFILGGGGAWLMMRFAAQWGIVDQPTGRSSHDQPTPSGGGVGILVAFILVSIVLNLPVIYWAAVAIVGVVSLVDDCSNLSSRQRLIVQFIAAVAVQYPLFSGRDVELIVVCPLVAVFIVGTANFYNFMDGIDGIAGLNGIVSFGFVTVFAVLTQNNEVAIVASCIVAACLGFLPFNFPAAKIFMGDVGSIVLGFLFAVLTVELAATVESMLLLVGFLALFYFDALTTLFLRWRQGETLTQAHRQHLYQVLVHRYHYSHPRVAIGYCGVQVVVSCALLISWRMTSLAAEMIVWLVLSGAFVWLRFRVHNPVANS